jgi:hypothetical protein
MGEERYRDWHIERIQETRITLYLFCLAGNTLLTAAVGGAVIYFSDLAVVPVAIGMGILGYAGAVAFFTLLSIWRLRRFALRQARLVEREMRTNYRTPAPATNGQLITAAVQEAAELQGK